jgi:hypothetical protein
MSGGQSHAPVTLLEDSGANEKKPPVSLYTAGFPCQPYRFLPEILFNDKFKPVTMIVNST